MFLDKCNSSLCKKIGSESAESKAARGSSEVGPVKEVTYSRLELRAKFFLVNFDLEIRFHDSEVGNMFDTSPLTSVAYLNH